MSGRRPVPCLSAALAAAALLAAAGPVAGAGAGATPAIQVTITDGPPAVTSSRSAVLEFSANEPGVTFRCSLDGARPTECGSPASYAGLGDGPHVFAVLGTDARGAYSDSDDRRWTVAGAPPPGPPPPGPPQPGPPTGGRVQRLAFKGPVTVGASRLRALARQKPPRRRGIDEELEADAEAPPFGCLTCPLLTGGEGLLQKVTPALTSPAFTISGVGNDPQIAAGKSYVLVTSYNRFWVYGKDGKLATKDKYGNSLSYPITASQLFKPLWDPPGSNAKGINGFLHLPASAPCDVADPFAPGSFCLNDYYDMRVVYDEFRDRFWLFASARNPQWKAAGTTPAQHVARRSKSVLAVSRTADPRDGFYLYWWNGVIDDGACTALGSSPGPSPTCPSSTYAPGDAADYPSLGISKDYFTQTIGVVNVNPFDPLSGPSVPDGQDTFPTSRDKYAVIHVFDAGKLASGGCDAPCSWSYWQFKYPGTNTTVKGIVQPAVQHDVLPSQYTVLASTSGSDTLWVWGFTAQEGALQPPLHGAQIKVNPFAAPINPAQPPKGAVTKPGRISFGNTGSLVMKAATRQGLMWATWQDCGNWVADSQCDAGAIRVVKVNPVLALMVAPNVQTGPIVDDTFGRNTLSDDADEIVAYGVPAIEVNEKLDAIVDYLRVGGKDVYPEARYTAFLSGEPDNRPSALLQKGAGPFGANVADAASVAGGSNLDTAGIAVDPFDDEAIWMAHGYSWNTGGGWRLAVGKVFGKPYADYLTSVGALALGAGNRLRARGVVRNQGDGTAPAARIVLSLVPAAARGSAVTAAARRGVRLGSLAVRRLRHGKTVGFRLRKQLSARVRPGRYRLKVALKPRRRVRQYDRRNDTVVSSRTVIVRRR